MRWLRRKSWLANHPGIEGDYQEIMHAMSKDPAKGVGYNPVTRGIINYGLFSVCPNVSAKGFWRWSPDKLFPETYAALMKTCDGSEEPWR